MSDLFTWRIKIVKYKRNFTITTNLYRLGMKLNLLLVNTLVEPSEDISLPVIVIDIHESSIVVRSEDGQIYTVFCDYVLCSQ